MVSWSKLWDLALNYGPKCVSAMRAFVRIISYPSCSNSVCLICDANNLDSSLLAHILNTHNIWMLLMVFHTSWIHCRLLPLFQTQTRTLIRFSLPQSWTHHASNSDSLSDFSQYFNMIYPLSTLFTCMLVITFFLSLILCFSSVTYALYF